MADKGLKIPIGGDASGLNDEVDKAAKKISDFADLSKVSIGQLQEAINELEDADWSGLSDEEIAASKNRMAELRKAYRELDESVDSMSQTTGQKAAEAFSSLTDMANGASAAIVMLGGNEEELNKMMQRTVGLMAVAQGAQEAALFFNQHAYGVFIKNKMSEIAAWMTETLTINSSTAAARAFNAVIAKNPILWLVAGVAALATATYALAKSFDTAAKEAEVLNSQIETMNRLMEDAKGWRDFQGQLEDVFETKGKDKRAIERLIQYRNELVALQSKLARLIELDKATEEQKKRYDELSDEIIKVGDEIILAKARQQKEDIEKRKEAEKKAQEEAKQRWEKSDAGRLAALEKAYDEEMRLLKNQLDNKFLEEDEYQKRVYALQSKYNEEASKLRGKTKLRIQVEAPEIAPESIKKANINIEDLIKIDTKNAENFINDLAKKIEAEAPKGKSIKIDNKIDMSSSVEGAISDFATMLGEAAATGDWSDFGSNILASMASFMQQVGAMFVAFGTAKMVFEMSGNPYVMIAAGAAMIAIGAGIKAATSKSASSSAISGGGASGGGGGASGGWDVSMQQASWGDRGSQVEFVIQGSNLVGVLNNENNRKSTY